MEHFVYLSLIVTPQGTHIYKDAVELLNDVRRVRENFYFLYAGTVRSTAALGKRHGRAFITNKYRSIYRII